MCYSICVPIISSHHQEHQWTGLDARVLQTASSRSKHLCNDWEGGLKQPISKDLLLILTSRSHFSQVLWPEANNIWIQFFNTSRFVGHHPSEWGFDKSDCEANGWVSVQSSYFVHVCRWFADWMQVVFYNVLFYLAGATLANCAFLKLLWCVMKFHLFILFQWRWLHIKPTDFQFWLLQDSTCHFGICEGWHGQTPLC